MNFADMSCMGRFRRILAFIFSLGLVGCTLSPGFEALLQTSEPVAFKIINVDTTQLTLTEGSVAIVNVILDSKKSTDTTVQLVPIGFTDRIEPLPLEITIPAGELSKPLTIQTVSDTTYQGSQFVSLNLLSLESDVRIDTANISLTVQDDDTPPTISIADDTRSEGAGTLSFPVTLDKASGVDTEVDFEVTDGTATLNQDYSTASGHVVIPAGDTSAVASVTIIDDTTSEFSETLSVTLSNPLNGTLATASAQGTITDNDLPIANFSASAQTIEESTGNKGPWHSNFTSWSKRRRIQIIGSTAELSNFPVMISLSSSNMDYSALQSQGQDLRFADNSGNELPFEIESWNNGGSSTVWVKVPTLYAAPNLTTVWMYYGNASAVDGQSKTNVWDSSFSGVWHLSGAATDSTSYGRNGTVNSASFASGLQGQALSVSGTVGSNIRLPDNMANSNVFTFSMAFKTSGNGVLLWHGTTAHPTTPSNYDPLLYIGTDGILRGGHWASTQPAFSSSGPINDNKWHTVTLTGNTNIQSIYLDGVLLGSASGTLNMSSQIVSYLGMGYWFGWTSVTAGWNSFNGLIDEVQFSTVSRSAAWIQATSMSLHNQMATVQSEESKVGNNLMTVNLNASSPEIVTLNYTVSGTSDSQDHNLAAGSLVIPAGDTSGTISFNIFRDQMAEGDESIVVTLENPTNAVLGSSKTHTITLTDESTAAPVVGNDAYTITNFVQQKFDVLSNDSDSNGDALEIVSFSSPSSGTVTNLGQALIYKPNDSFAGTDTFTYTVSDHTGYTATATVTITFQIPFTWIGGISSNWSTPGNWLGGVVPTSTSTAYLNNQCTNFCNPTLSANTTVGGVKMASSFSGSLNQGAYSFEVAATSYDQKGGTFNGSTATVTFKNFILSGGTFNSTSGNLVVKDDITLSGSPSFNHANGTLLLPNTPTSGHKISNSSSNVKFYNLTINLGAHWSDDTSVTGTFVFEGNIMLNSGSYPGNIRNGVFEVYGNITAMGNNKINDNGTTVFKLVGTNQIVTSDDLNKRFGNITIASQGTVTFAPIVAICNDLKWISGTVDTTTHNSTVYLGPRDGPKTIDLGTQALNNVYFSMGAGWGDTYSIVGTLKVMGDLTFKGGGYNPSINNGVIEAYKNVTLTTQNTFVNSPVRIVGGVGSQVTISTEANGPSFKNLEIASLGQVTLSPAAPIKIRGNLTYVSGSVVTTDSTVLFSGDATQTIAANGINFNHVTFSSSSQSALTLDGPLNVLGNLVLHGSGYWPALNAINSGVLRVAGDVTVSGNWSAGNVPLLLNGSGAQNLTRTGGVWPQGNVQISNTTGVVTMNSNIIFNGPAQDLTVDAGGTLNLNGYNLSIGRNIYNNGTIQQGTSPTCGTISQGGSLTGNTPICP